MLAATRHYAEMVRRERPGKRSKPGEERKMRSPAGREPANERGGNDTHRPVVWHVGSIRHRPNKTGKMLLANHYCSVAIVVPICQLARNACALGESVMVMVLVWS